MLPKTDPVAVVALAWEDQAEATLAITGLNTMPLNNSNRQFRLLDILP